MFLDIFKDSNKGIKTELGKKMSFNNTIMSCYETLSSIKICDEREDENCSPF